MQRGLSKGAVKVAAFLSASVVGACGATKQNNSDTKHSVDDPTRGTGAFQWADVTPEQMNEVMGPLMGTSASSFLPADHELVRRVQFWLDEIDASIRRDHPDQLASTPKPQARVLKAEVPNAFVSPVLVCHEIPVQIKTSGSGRVVDRVFLDAGSGSFEELPETDPQTGTKYGCVEGKNSESTLKALAAEFNGNSSGCKLQVSGTGSDAKLVPNAACQRSQNLAGVKAAKKLVIMQTANFVTIHTGLFNIMSEETLVSVITHELGHYYRSHSTAQDSTFGYFYTQNRRNATERPRPEPELQEIGERAYEASVLLSNADSLQDVAGAKLRSELYFGAGLLVSALSQEAGASDECKDASEMINAQEFAQAIGRFPLGRQPTDGQKAAYQYYEKAVLGCLATVKLSDRSDALSGDAAGWDVVRAAAAGTQWPHWVFTSASTVRGVGRINKLTSIRLGDDAPSAATIAEALEKASLVLDEQDKDYFASLKEAFDRRVGQYTYEQEADDHGAEWLADVGIDPRFAVDAMRRLGDGSRSGLGGLLLGSEDCNKLADAGWIGQNGAYTFVPVGNFAEVHHSVCYRMFNLTREIEAHAHRASSSNRPQLLGTDGWRRLQASAAAANKSVSAAPTESLHLASLLQKTSMGQCIYSYAYGRE